MKGPKLPRLTVDRTEALPAALSVKTVAPIPRLTVDRTEALPATFVQSNALLAILMRMKVLPDTLM